MQIYFILNYGFVPIATYVVKLPLMQKSFAFILLSCPKQPTSKYDLKYLQTERWCCFTLWLIAHYNKECLPGDTEDAFF